MHILVISLCARHSKNLECSRPVQGLKQLALAHKSVCINWRLHSQGFCGVCLGLYHIAFLVSGSNPTDSGVVHVEKCPADVTCPRIPAAIYMSSYRHCSGDRHNLDCVKDCLHNSSCMYT